MASVETGKRPKVQTERMQEFMRSHGDVAMQGHKLLKCPQEGCDKVLTSSPGLRYHMRTHYGMDRPYTCSRCRRSFKSSNGLKYHTEKTKCEGMLSSNVSGQMVTIEREHMTNMEDISILECDEGEDSFPPDDDDDYPGMYSISHAEYRPTPLTLDVGVSHLKSNMASIESVASSEMNNPLTELAIIATGPQSPLLQKSWSRGLPSPTKSAVKCNITKSIEETIHSYARPPRTPSPGMRINRWCISPVTEESDPRVTSSSPYPASPKADLDGGSWSHSWPTSVWQCFVQGTRLRFTSGNKTDWQLAEDLASKESLAAQALLTQESREKLSYAPHGLKVINIEECRLPENSKESIMRLRFSSTVHNQPEIISECALDHPFFVKDKGWSSFHPSLTVQHYGIPCSELEVNDICLQPSHPEATFTTDVFESFKSYDFTPEDSSAVFALSNMAKVRRDQELSPKSSPYSSPTSSPNKKRPTKNEPIRAKRPMNAFMLFAKRFRVEYTQQFPGKDNRAISVLLGDRWKKMKSEERKAYSVEAKTLADQHKKMHPDCWKRKRSASGSVSE